MEKVQQVEEAYVVYEGEEYEILNTSDLFDFSEQEGQPLGTIKMTHTVESLDTGVVYGLIFRKHVGEYIIGLYLPKENVVRNFSNVNDSEEWIMVEKILQNAIDWKIEKGEII